MKKQEAKFLIIKPTIKMKKQDIKPKRKVKIDFLIIVLIVSVIIFYLSIYIIYKFGYNDGVIDTLKICIETYEG